MAQDERAAADLEKQQQQQQADDAGDDDGSSWLRAMVLGANDGLVSIAALEMGVCAVERGERWDVIVAGLAGLVAGACSMSLGEFVSVSAQRDAQLAQRRRRSSKAVVAPPPLVRPLQAALVSAAAFSVGGAVPLLASLAVSGYAARLCAIGAATTVGLAAFGGGAAKVGGTVTGVAAAAARSTLGGWIAMLLTFGILGFVAHYR